MIPVHQRPVLLSSAVRITNADGNALRCLGQALFHLRLGPVKIEKTLLIGDIEDDALLGMDVLISEKGSPADILLSENKIVLENTTIPLVSLRSRVRRVTAAYDVSVPPQSEKIVDVSVERFPSDGNTPNNVLYTE